MNRTRIAVLAAVFACAPLAAGCGLVPHSKVYQPPHSVGGAHYGRTLNVGIGQPQGIDPADAYESYGRMISSLICEPLVSADPKTGEIKSALAQSWHYSDSGRSIYITLRHGLRFANGDPLNASSVYDALNLLASPGYQSYVAGLLADVSGYANYHNGGHGTQSSSRLNGVRIIDSWSLQIQLATRDSSFLSVLADPATAPIDGHVQRHDPAAFAADPVCLGPYRLAAPWRAGDPTITLIRNPAYRPDDAAYTNEGRGYPSRIVFHVYPLAAAEQAAYRSGQIDVATDPGTRLDRLANNFGSQLVTGPGTGVDLISFPTAQPAFAQPAVRVALSQAIDRTAIAQQAYRQDRLPLTGLLPPAVGRTAHDGSSCANAPVRGDPAAARQTLARAHVDLAGRTINLYYDDEFGHGRMARQVAAEWQQTFGAKVVTHGMAWDDYITHAATGASFDGPFLESWDQLPYRQIDYVEPLLTRQGLGTANLSRFDSPDVVNLMQSLTDDVGDSSGQVVELHELGRIGCTQMPVAPVTLHRAALLVRGSAVGTARGIYLALDGSPLLREMFLR